MKIPYPILIGLLGGGLFVALWEFNDHVVRTKIRRDAIAHGVGTYVVNPTNGATSFVWRTCATNAP